MIPLPGRIAPAPAMAKAFQEFSARSAGVKGVSVALRKSADISKFPDSTIPHARFLPATKGTAGCVAAQDNTFPGRLSADCAGNQRGSEEGGTMLLIRM